MKRNYHQRVIDGSVCNQRRYVSKWDQAHRRVFRASERRFFDKLNVAREKAVQPVVLNGRIRTCLSQSLNVMCLIPCFLEQLAPGGFDCRLAFVNHAARNLQSHLVCAMAVLLNHHTLVISR